MKNNELKGEKEINLNHNDMKPGSYISSSYMGTGDRNNNFMLNHKSLY